MPINSIAVGKRRSLTQLAFILRWGQRWKNALRVRLWQQISSPSQHAMTSSISSDSVSTLGGEIYLISNTENDLEYVGQTRKLRTKRGVPFQFGYKRRFREHVTSAKGKPTYHIDRMMKQAGVDRFTVTLLEECSLAALDAREVHHIQARQTLTPKGYNVVCGNPHTNSNPEWTSASLKAYYSDPVVRAQHSLAHIGNNMPFRNGISSLEIKPINENGENKLIYLIVRYSDGSEQRRRYGGLHQTFDAAYARSLADVALLPGVPVKNHVRKTDIEMRIAGANLGNIHKVQIKLHKMGQQRLTSVYISHDASKTQSRYVFGGKTQTLQQAYTKAKEFVSLLPREDNVTVLEQPALLATLSNCGKALKP